MQVDEAEVEQHQLKYGNIPIEHLQKAHDYLQMNITSYSLSKTLQVAGIDHHQTLMLMIENSSKMLTIK
jgi:hypothetical protein